MKLSRFNQDHKLILDLEVNFSQWNGLKSNSALQCSENFLQCSSKFPFWFFVSIMRKISERRDIYSFIMQAHGAHDFSILMVRYLRFPQEQQN